LASTADRKVVAWQLTMSQILF